jgi:hypothetical protein
MVRSEPHLTDGQDKRLTVESERRLKFCKLHDRDLDCKHREEESDRKYAISYEAPFETANARSLANVYHCQPAHDGFLLCGDRIAAAYRNCLSTSEVAAMTISIIVLSRAT